MAKTQSNDRPATLAAFVNAVVVYLLPLALVGAIALVAPAYTNGSTHVVGVDPDRAAVWSRRVHFIAFYVMGLLGRVVRSCGFVPPLEAYRTDFDSDSAWSRFAFASA